MKNKILIMISFFFLICIANSNVYANTKFNVERKSLKIYDKLNIADMNNDGAINSLDASIIIDMYKNNI